MPPPFPTLPAFRRLLLVVALVHLVRLVLLEALGHLVHLVLWVALVRRVLLERTAVLEQTEAWGLMAASHLAV